MPKVLVVVVLVALVSACGGGTRKTLRRPLVKMPYTTEAQACSRECLAIKSQCKSATRYAQNPFNGALMPVVRHDCEREHFDCASGCPGAMVLLSNGEYGLASEWAQ